MLGALLLTAIAIAACARSAPPQRADRGWFDRNGERASTIDPRYGTSPSPRLYTDGMAIPKGGGIYKVGAPYQIAGRWYTPREEPGYDRIGIASWYGDDFHGRKTANGEIYDMRALSAAHPTLPMPSYVWVTSLSSNRTVLVRVNDRGPYAHDRVIDLSKASARALGFEGQGLARVRVRYAGPAPLNGDDRREQAYLRSQPWYGLAAPVAIAGRQLPYMRPYADGARRDQLRGGWRPTLATASIDPLPEPMPVDELAAPPRSSRLGATASTAVIAGQFRNRHAADRLADELQLVAKFRVYAIPGTREPAFEVRSDAMDFLAADELRSRLVAAGVREARLVAE